MHAGTIQRSRCGRLRCKWTGQPPSSAAFTLLSKTDLSLSVVTYSLVGHRIELNIQQVLISFGVSILVMITTIVYGYLTRSLRPDRYNALDDFVLDTFGWAKEQDKAYTRRRVIAIEKFLLSLSDQQLVTGISLIIANYPIRFGVADLNQRVSAYSYVIAVHLALLSCIIHLSSLTILRDHFDIHTRLRSFRICLILPAIGFLLPQLVLAQDIDSSVTLSCGLDLLHFSQSQLSYWDPDIQIMSINLQTVAILIIISGGYIRRVIEVYFPLFRKSPDVWTARACSKFIGYPKQCDIDLFMDRSCEAQITSAARLVDFRGRMKQTPVVAIAGSLVAELRRSFFTEIAWLLFYTTYSLSNLTFFFLWGGTADQSRVTFYAEFRSNSSVDAVGGHGLINHGGLRRLA